MRGEGGGQREVRGCDGRRHRGDARRGHVCAFVLVRGGRWKHSPVTAVCGSIALAKPNTAKDQGEKGVRVGKRTRVRRELGGRAEGGGREDPLPSCAASTDSLEVLGVGNRHVEDQDLPCVLNLDFRGLAMPPDSQPGRRCESQNLEPGHLTALVAMGSLLQPFYGLRGKPPKDHNLNLETHPRRHQTPPPSNFLHPRLLAPCPRSNTRPESFCPAPAGRASHLSLSTLAW